MKKSFSYYLGTSLIILSIAGLLFTFYPVINLYLFPSPPVKAVAAKEGFILYIPKINATGDIIENVDAFDQVTYTESLKKGIAHAKGTALPGEDSGTTFLFAHSSGAPWELTRYNTIFLRLGELEKKDQIILYRNNKEYKYEVIDKKEVWPNEVSYLLETENDQLILQTCTPIGTDLKRLLIFAQPVNSQ